MPINASQIDQLRQWMQANNVSQTDLARLSGVSRSMICHILAGRRAVSKSILDIINEA